MKRGGRKKGKKRTGGGKYEKMKGIEENMKNILIMNKQIK